MYQLVEYQASDAMTYRPVTVSPKSSLAELEALFEEHDHDCLPVCNEDGALLGIVTKLDFLRAFAVGRETMIPRYEEIMKRPVASVMTSKAITIRPETRFTRVLQLMVETGHKSFPVTTGALLLGMIARRDVVRALKRAAVGEPARAGEEQGDATCTIPASSVR